MEETDVNKKKDFWLSIIGLAVILIGAVVMICMDWPIGLLMILPSAIPHIIRLRDLAKENR